MRQRLASAVLLGAASAVLVLLDPLRGLPHGDVADWTVTAPEQALGLVAACAAWVFALWLAVVIGLALLVQTLVPTSRCARGAARMVRSLVPRGLRPLLRPVLGAALGGALVLGPQTSALAAGGVPAPVPAVSAPVTVVPSTVPLPIVAPPAPPLPRLDWVTPPAPAPTTSPAPPAPAPTTSARLHTVVSGDTLWDLATAQLPAGASAAAITTAWQRIYAANRTVVGPDPSFLLPGEILSVGDRS